MVLICSLPLVLLVGERVVTTSSVPSQSTVTTWGVLLCTLCQGQAGINIFSILFAVNCVARCVKYKVHLLQYTNDSRDDWGVEVIVVNCLNFAVIFLFLYLHKILNHYLHFLSWKMSQSKCSIRLTSHIKASNMYKVVYHGCQFWQWTYKCICKSTNTYSYWLTLFTGGCSGTGSPWGRHQRQSQRCHSGTLACVEFLQL